MVRGAIFGPLALVAIAYFWSHPSALGWVAAIAALPFVIGGALGIGDGLRARRAAAAPPTVVVPPGIDARPDLAQHRALRGRFDGWRYASPAARPRAPADEAAPPTEP